jgi:hypothetical protein
VDKSLLLSSLEGSNLVRINKSLFPGGLSVLKKPCCSFSWVQFTLVVLVKMLLISPVLSKVAAR